MQYPPYKAVYIVFRMGIGVYHAGGAAKKTAHMNTREDILLITAVSSLCASASQRAQHAAATHQATQKGIRSTDAQVMPRPRYKLIHANGFLIALFCYSTHTASLSRSNLVPFNPFILRRPSISLKGP